MNSSCVFRSECKLPLRGWITYRHCRQPILSNFFYLSNRLFGGGAADAGNAVPTSASVCRRCRNEPWTGLDTNANCQRLMQWNAIGISGKITELLTLLLSNNVNIAAIQEIKLTNKNKPLKTAGWAAVQLDRHKNKGGVLLMQIKTRSPSSTSRPLFQSSDHHLE